jgi:hypothetical protein
MSDKNDTTVVHTGSSGGAGWFVAVVIVLLVAGGGFYMYQSGALSGGSKDVNVEIKLPTPPAATE